MSKKKKNTKFYSTLAFDDRTMKKCLSDKVYKKLKLVIDQGAELSLKDADEIAAAMKDWAIKHGATHFTHWFQPLSGTTSEKHDSFLVPKGDAGKAILSFSGKDLIKGESDASSLPSGGLRATFEARGYTAWDPSSNAFIKDEVLCIPTAFCSYNGDALDKKTPLLRSQDALKTQVTRFMMLFDNTPERVIVNIGAEQEFFLIPEDTYAQREDLVMCGRTLFGNKPAKGQELEEHYFGSIRPTVNNYLKLVDEELWALGISVHTKHNEAAPSQHELAPIYTNANRAVDENLIMMEKMKLLASKFNMACLLHERPFDGINGSGKHCNWSISADGKNLLDPGTSDEDNLRFFAVLACVIAAVDDYQELLRMSVASIGNDLRLGGNEAPPAIVSIFLGSDLDKMIKAISSGKSYQSLKDEMDLGVSVLPRIMRDGSDRNRTSPFAFTANKFEFRMPGSQVNLSDSITVLNTAFASALSDFCDQLDKSKLELDDAVMTIAATTINKHKRILFDGDGYSKDWEREAKKRDLTNYKTTAEALKCISDKKSIKLFEKFNVLSETELKSRYVIKLEKYNKLMNIEATVMHRMTKRQYIPAISAYASEIARQIKECSISKVNLKHQKILLDELLEGLNNIHEALYFVNDLNRRAKRIKNEQKRADFNANKLAPSMLNLRNAVDRMEHITARDYWPVPSYNNMLFYT
ncbi:MAG: glutamine synthetase III [Coriobacteriia bacterium]|nr:glutamine synthetase III [Coriobacteriia bacterium]